MNAPTRTFAARPAKREAVPLLIGLCGPSGSGKTFSALRLATGIQTVTGGDIYGIDTEARRMLHYADLFKYQHIQFDAPFSSADYLAALQECVARGAKTIIVDSLSHEHESAGGLLDTHEKELDRLAGADPARREKLKFLAWQKPKAARRALITGLLQLNANFIFCFRAKATVKPVKIGGKVEIVPQGYLPIAGEELLFEMTVNMMLPPHSGGMPIWDSENAGEKFFMKLPVQFKTLFAGAKPLDENIGARLAEWAKGGAGKDGRRTETDVRDNEGNTVTSDPTPSSATNPIADDGDLLSNARKFAAKGEKAFAKWFKDKTPGQKSAVANIGEELRGLMDGAD